VQSEFAYRGRKVSAAEIEGIRALIAAHPGYSRWRLSFKLCEAWNWVQPNGQPRAMLARSLMLGLHRAGHIQLPAQRFHPPNNVVRHRAPVIERASAEDLADLDNRVERLNVWLDEVRALRPQGLRVINGGMK